MIDRILNTLLKVVAVGAVVKVEVLISVEYSGKDIQDIKDIRKIAQYQEIGGIFTSPYTFFTKIRSLEKSFIVKNF